MQQAPAAQIEYTIYTFDMPATKQKGQNSWKKHSSVDDMSKAMNEAETLHQTRKYQKIEVKKKFFDQKKNRTVDMTLKVFEAQAKKDYTMILLVVGAIVCTGVAFAASFFLTKGM